MTKDADFKKQTRARMATTGEAYTTARMQLLRHRNGGASAGPDAPNVLHVTNGDSVVYSLRDSGLGGTVVAWQDVLHEGPVPGTATAEELRSIRPRYVADRWSVPYEDAQRAFMERDPGGAAAHAGA